LNMTYEIIKNSESYAGFNIPDKEYKGQIDGLCCGWSFEFQNDKGEYNYNSTTYYEGTPEEYCQTWLQYGEEALFEIERWNGWIPTGRVVFRGYGKEYYDSNDREYYIEDVEV